MVTVLSQFEKQFQKEKQAFQAFLKRLEDSRIDGKLADTELQLVAYARLMENNVSSLLLEIKRLPILEGSDINMIVKERDQFDEWDVAAVKQGMNPFQSEEDEDKEEGIHGYDDLA